GFYEAAAIRLKDRDQARMRSSGCYQPLVEIDHWGERLTGCPRCNRWQAATGEWCRLAADDIVPLRSLDAKKESRQNLLNPGPLASRVELLVEKLQLKPEYVGAFEIWMPRCLLVGRRHDVAHKRESAPLRRASLHLLCFTYQAI